MNAGPTATSGAFDAAGGGAPAAAVGAGDAAGGGVYTAIFFRGSHAATSNNAETAIRSFVIQAKR